MVIFKWSRDLETGIILLDKQHREVIEAANRFFLRCKCGKDRDAVNECLAFLQQYILYHFQTEEAFQLDCGYPRYKEHCANHKYLSTQIKFFSVRMNESNQSAKLIEEFYAFMVEWIQTHIYEEDLAFAHYYREQRLSPSQPESGAKSIL